MKALAILVAVLPNFAKIFVLRMLRGATIGRNVKIGFGSVLLIDLISIADNAYIGSFTFIRAHELRMATKASIGSLTRISTYAVEMEPRSTIGSQVSVIGEHEPGGRFTMGMYSWIFQYCYINVSRPIRLGKNVGVGGGTYIFTHGYWLSKLDGYPVGYGQVDIGDNTWLPWGCFIMPGVTIGKNVVVGARSVITKSVPDGALVAGIPAKVIRDQSNKSMSSNEKYEILDSLIRDYVSHLSTTLNVERKDSSTYYELGSDLRINVCDDISGLHSGQLNICWAKLDEIILYNNVAWSLFDYLSSPEKMFSKPMVDFLLFSRCIGLRFYPIDEL